MQLSPSFVCKPRMHGEAFTLRIVLHGSTKKRRSTGVKFNALFRRNTSSKGSAGAEGTARKAYMRGAGGDALYGGSRGGC